MSFYLGRDFSDKKGGGVSPYFSIAVSCQCSTEKVKNESVNEIYEFDKFHLTVERPSQAMDVS